MEREAALRLWPRSLGLGFKYSTMISDGDPSALIHLQLCMIIEAHTMITHLQKVSALIMYAK